MLLSFAACGDKGRDESDSPNIYTPVTDETYDEYEVTVTDDTYEYMGNPVEVGDLYDIITGLDDGSKTFTVVDYTSGSVLYSQLCGIFDELGISYRTAGQSDDAENPENAGNADSSDNISVSAAE